MIKAETNKPEYRKTIEKTNKIMNWFFENIKNSLPNSWYGNRIFNLKTPPKGTLRPRLFYWRFLTNI